jgi:hypothetical protein
MVAEPLSGQYQGGHYSRETLPVGGQPPPCDWQTGWHDERHSKIKTLMQATCCRPTDVSILPKFLLRRDGTNPTYQLSLSTSTQRDNHSCAGQVFLGDAPTGTATSRKRVGTPYQLTSWMSLLTKSLTSLEKVLSSPPLTQGDCPHRNKR